MNARVLTPDERINAAKSRLVLRHPFFGTLCLGMGFEWSEDVPTAAVDDECIYMNQEFLATLTNDELVFVLAHECMHPALRHTQRIGSRDRHLWNCAGDYVINEHLVEQGVGKPPAKLLLDHELFVKGDGQTEKIYRLLQEEAGGTPDDDYEGTDGSGGVEGGESGEGNKHRRGKGKGGQSPKNRQPLDEIREGGKDKGKGGQSEAERNRAAEQWRVRVAQAAAAAKMCGKLSGGLARLVGELLEPQVSWRDQLAAFMTRCADDTRSWSRFARRLLPQGIYAPARSGEAMGEIVVAIDTSGSISDKELRAFGSELNGILNEAQPAKTTVVWFDSEVAGVDEFPRGEPLVLNPRGGGGTDFAPVMGFVADNCADAACVVVLTDLCCESFGDEPQCPVLWCSTERRRTVPFGEVIEIKV